MKKLVLLIVVALLAVCSIQPAQAYWRGGIWIDPWYVPYYYPAPYYPAQPPVVIEQQPAMQAQPEEPPQPVQQYWYYCPNPAGYYPYVKHCPTPWMKVVPSAPSQSDDAMKGPSIPPDFKSGPNTPPPPPQ
jgi:hypothetical protein